MSGLGLAGEAVSGTIIHDRFEGVKEAVEGGVLPFPPSAGGEVPAQLGGHALLVFPEATPSGLALAGRPVTRLVPGRGAGGRPLSLP